MGKLVRDLGPLAIAVVVAALVIGYLVASGNNIGNWLLAGFLVGHGWVHMMYVIPQPKANAIPQPKANAATSGGPDWAFDLNSSWLAVGSGGLHAFGLLLVAVTVVGYTLAGLATIPLLVPVEAWAPLVLGSSIVSAALMALFFNPGLLLGLAIDAGLVVAVVFSSWRPG